MSHLFVLNTASYEYFIWRCEAVSWMRVIKTVVYQSGVARVDAQHTFSTAAAAALWSGSSLRASGDSHS